jgi:hypothetical protein
VKYLVSLLLLFATVSFIQKSSADALIINQSMLASSIIEFYIDDKGVTAELEISLDALPVFKNLLPDEVYQNLSFGNEDAALRQQEFFSKQLALLTSNNKPLPGELLSIGPSRKVLRDRINGTPLPIQDDAPQIIRASIRYHFEPGNQPEQLSFVSQTASDIGFVVYHNKVAVNDFRYLRSGYTLVLDWQDPWYSHFESRRLRRQYHAPMSGFIYVEPFEVRKEIIARPKDLQRWIDLGLEGKTTIPVAMQAEIKEKVAGFLAQHQPVTIDGKPRKGILDSVNFLERTLTSSRVIDPPVPLGIDAAILGAIFVYPQKGLPQQVTMDWDLWDERIVSVPVSAVDQAGPLPSFLDREWTQLEWKNFLKFPEIPTLESIQAPAPEWKQLLAKSLPVTALFLVLSVGWMYRVFKQKKPQTLPAGITLMLLAGVLTALLLGESNSPQPERAEIIVGKLLHNVYRAFDYRDESEIYDVLERSVTGELLTNIYLETKRSLVLANQGGAQAKVKNVQLEALQLKPVEDDNIFSADVNWTVNGSVGHWGHIHQRSNRYQAVLTIVAAQNQWKLQEMTVLQEERL